MKHVITEVSQNTSKEHKKSGNQQQGGGAKKRETRQAARKKETRPNFSHPWLSCSLKNHAAPILDMDFSANGKYLISCAEGDLFENYTLQKHSLISHAFVSSLELMFVTMNKGVFKRHLRMLTIQYNKMNVTAKQNIAIIFKAQPLGGHCPLSF